MSIPPPSGYSLEVAWPQPSDTLCEEVVNFWVGESALPANAASQRVRELMLVARRKGEGVAAVCTVQSMFVQRLACKCFAYRTFIGSKNRTQGLRSAGQLAWSLFTRTYTILNQSYQQGEFPDHAGLFMEVENRNIRRRLDQCVWTEDTLRRRREVTNEVLDKVGNFGMNVVYLGVTPKGNHARIWYFSNSRIPKASTR